MQLRAGRHRGGAALVGVAAGQAVAAEGDLAATTAARDIHLRTRGELHLLTGGDHLAAALAHAATRGVEHAAGHHLAAIAATFTTRQDDATALFAHRRSADDA